jgi:hypothetical protein
MALIALPVDKGRFRWRRGSSFAGWPGLPRPRALVVIRMVGQVLGGDAVEAGHPFLEPAVIGVDVVEVEVGRLGLGSGLARRRRDMDRDARSAGEAYLSASAAGARSDPRAVAATGPPEPDAASSSPSSALPSTFAASPRCAAVSLPIPASQSTRAQNSPNPYSTLIEPRKCKLLPE